MTKKLPIEVKVLTAMKKAMSDGHWIKGEYAVTKSNKGTCYCLVGACNKALATLEAKNQIPNNVSRWDIKNRVLDAMGFDCESSATSWNDMATRRIEHVFGRIDGGIGYLKGERAKPAAPKYKMGA